MQVFGSESHEIVLYLQDSESNSARALDKLKATALSASGVEGSPV